MIVKGFSIPGDTGKFLKAPLYILLWNSKIRKSGFNNIVRTLKNSDTGKPFDSKDFNMLVQYHRLFGFMLTRIMHHKNPCTVSALSLFDICSKNNINCRLIVGADKENNSIKGHTWVEVNGVPVNENKETLEKYTRIIEV